MKYEMVDCSGRKGDIIGEGKIKSDYLIITDPVEKILFKDLEIFKPTAWADDFSEITWCQDPITLDEDELGIEQIIFTNKPIKIHKSIVKEICTPKEGHEGVFIIQPNDALDYVVNFYHSNYFGFLSIKANALTIGKTVGELKELIKWYNS